MPSVRIRCIFLPNTASRLIADCNRLAADLHQEVRSEENISAMTDCVIMRIDKTDMVRTLRDEPKLAEVFMAYILARNARVEEDLVDQPFQLQRKASGEGAFANGQLWQRRETGAGDSQNQPRDARRDCRYHALAREQLHE